MNTIQYITRTPSGRVYQFSTLAEKQKFELFWRMGVIADLEPDPQQAIINYLTKMKTK